MGGRAGWGWAVLEMWEQARVVVASGCAPGARQGLRGGKIPLVTNLRKTESGLVLQEDRHALQRHTYEIYTNTYHHIRVNLS